MAFLRGARRRASGRRDFRSALVGTPDRLRGRRLGVLTHQGWWPQLALASAIISLMMIELWWGSLVTGSAFFALVFDIVVIVVMLRLRR